LICSLRQFSIKNGVSPAKGLSIQAPKSALMREICSFAVFRWVSA
jgi:hypothetical protein